MKTIYELSDAVRETAYAVHLYLGHGHLERVYENALAHRLKKAGFKIKQQYPVNIYDEDETLIGQYFVDLLVENSLIIELKTCQWLASEHATQILGYLKATEIEHGLLINFGSYKFQIKKFALTPRKKQNLL